MDLMPLPNGGVLVSHKDTFSAFSPNGDLRWEEENRSYLVAWTMAEDVLLFTTTDKEKPLMSADNQGLVIWEETLPGIPLAANGFAWLYAEDGLYQLDVADQTTQRVYDLPTALLRRSTAISMSDGSVLLFHSDIDDRRLLAFDNQGTLMWEFSIPLDDDPQLFELDGEIYLLNKPSFSSRGSYRSLQIFLVDSENGQLSRIFEGGSRTFDPRHAWINAVNQQKLWIQIGDIGGLLFDPQSAQTRMGQ
jgi:hypothetical protein